MSTSEPAIGFELECRRIALENHSEAVASISNDYETSAHLKGKPFIIPGIPKYPNWSLTAETLSDSIKRIATEAKVAGPDREGTGVKFSSNPEIGATIGKEIVTVVNTWAPHKGLEVMIEGFEKFGPWIVQAPEKPTGSQYLNWGLQVTTPFPLSVIPSLVIGPSILLERKVYPKLTKDMLPWTGSKKNGTAKYLDNLEVLGFLTIVLGYVKAAGVNDPSQGPKHSSPIMPRTDFRTMYAQVKTTVKDWIQKVHDNPEVTEHYGFKVVDLKSFVLAVGIDCGFRPKGEKDFPDSLVLRWEDWHSTKGEIHQLSIKDWLVDLPEDKDTVDLVSSYDKEYQAGQIGGLGKKMEKIIGGAKPLPIFEFRDLSAVFTGDIPKRLQDLEKAVRKAHKDSL